VGTADISEGAASGLCRRNTGDKNDLVDVTPPGWNCFEYVLAEYPLALCALAVNDRRFARNRNCFRDVSDTQLRIDCGDECPGELDSFPLDRGEAGQCKRDRIDSRAKILNLVLPRTIRYD